MSHAVKSSETPTEKLHRLLEEQGFVIDAWAPAIGYWRREDVYRWSASATKGNLKCTLDSWDTITKCAREGIVVLKDTLGCPCAFDVYAKSSAPSK